VGRSRRVEEQLRMKGTKTIIKRPNAKTGRVLSDVPMQPGMGGKIRACDVLKAATGRRKKTGEGNEAGSQTPPEKQTQLRREEV